MKNLNQRFWTTAAVVVICCIGTIWVRKGYVFEVVPLAADLTTFPLELDGWSGKDTPLDQDTLKVLNAQTFINRVYHNPEGAAVSVNVAAWLLPETVSDVSPHIPKVCYTNTGWQINKERTVEIKTPQGNVPVLLMQMQRKDERIVVGYWYQMGKAFFHVPNEARQIQQQLWGKTKWPATVKVLLHTNATSLEAALPRIEAFAVLIERQLTEPQSQARVPLSPAADVAVR